MKLNYCQTITLLLVLAFLSLQATASTALLKKRYEQLEELTKMEEKLKMYETLVHTELKTEFDAVRFRNTESNSTIYKVPDRSVGPLGVNCTTPDCQEENMNFYKGVISKLKAENGADGPLGDKGFIGDIGPKGDRGQAGKDAEVPTTEYLEYLTDQTIHEVMDKVASGGV